MLSRFDRNNVSAAPGAVGFGIEPVTLGLIAAGIGAAGGVAGALGTAKSQASQNAANAQNAAAQSAQSFYNYLASRGVNLQQLIAQFPEFQQEYERARAENGERRDFQTWFHAAIQAQQDHPIWTAIANPAGTAGAANTTLPAWAVDASGNPLQPSLFNDLVNQYAGRPQIAPGASVDDIRVQLRQNGAFAAMPEDWQTALAEQVQQQGLSATLAGNLSWAAENPDDPSSVFLGQWAQSGGVATPGSGGTPSTAGPGAAGTGSTATLDPAIAALVPKATDAAAGLYNGTYLNEVLTGLKPVEASRDAQAAAAAARIEELRRLSGEQLGTELTGISSVLDARTAGAGGIYDASTAAANQVYAANVDKLAALLGVRREAAQAIYDASTQSAGGVRDARTTGARDIYGAESLQADTYAQAGEQALNRVLASQSAERARRGFTGGSSGNDITRARLMSDAIQRGAGARAQAGVNLENRLSDTGVGYATDVGQAGIGRATTIGQSTEADAMAQLQAAVQLAQQLGLAGTNKATTLAGAGEQNAIAELQARVADAQRRMGYLTSDADLAKAQADYDNALGQLNALVADQNRKVGAIGLPFQLAGSDLALKSALTEQQYVSLDALLKRLPSFQTTPAGGPTLTASPVGSVINPTQTLGAGLGALGTGLTGAASNTALQQQIANWMAQSGGGAGTANTPGSSITNPVNTAVPLVGSGSYLGGGSVFPGPG